MHTHQRLVSSLTFLWQTNHFDKIVQTKIVTPDDKFHQAIHKNNELLAYVVLLLLSRWLVVLRPLIMFYATNCIFGLQKGANPWQCVADFEARLALHCSPLPDFLSLIRVIWAADPPSCTSDEALFCVCFFVLFFIFALLWFWYLCCWPGTFCLC